MLKLGILGSTNGTVMLSLLAAIKQKDLAAKISVVLSNKQDARILENAKHQQLKAIFVDGANTLSKEAYDQQLSDILKSYQIDLIVLIGYMRILSKQFTDTWKNKIINIHPSLLPAYSGWMNRNVHQAVIDNHDKETGCTVHLVTDVLDSGPILMQKKCYVLPGDSVEQLKSRVQNLEAVSLIEVINQFAKNKNE